MKKLYCCFVISLFWATPCAAQVIIVDANGTGDYPTIQAAINAANTGDVIELQQGTYTGTGNRDIDFLGKAITVCSTNPQDPCVVASTVIDCQGGGRGFYFHSGEGANSILNGLKITNGYVTTSSPGGSAGGGIYCGNQSGPTIANCDISGNTAVGGLSGGTPKLGLGGGLYGSNGTITNCTISENTADGMILIGGGRGGGLYACNGTITNCTISGNTADDEGSFGGVGARGGGLYACNGTITNCTISGNKADDVDSFVGSGGGFYACNGTIENCTISGNSADRGLGGGLFDCGGPITNCIIWGNSAIEGPEIYSSSNPTYSCIKDWIGGGIGNIGDDPLFTNPNNDNYRPLPDSPCIDTGDPYYVAQPNETDLDGKPRIIGGRIDMGAYENQEPIIIYVDANAPGANDGTSWESAFRFLQDALSDADSAIRPVEIRIAEGIYKPDQGDGITTGDQTVSFQLINGVTLKGGYAGYGEPDPNNRDIELYETILSGDLNGDDGPDFTNMADNSIHVVNGSSTEPNAVLDGLTICSGRGTGMYNYGGSPTLADCTFSYNFANEGGGMYNVHFSDPVVTNCKFSYNQAVENGGAMCNENSNPVVTGCTFAANSTMRFNFGFGGAVYNEGCSPTFDYCTFSENLSEFGGGGMYNRDSSPTLTNCTFEGNWSGLHGGGFDTVMESSNPILIGCRFIGNSADYSGGGTSNGTSSLTLMNCIFIDNSASDSGGGMYSVSGRNIDVTNCTFYGNEASNGNTLACRSGSTVQLTNCIIWDGGNEIWNPRGSMITLIYSDVCGGHLSVYDPCESIIWGEGNIDADPCFADVNNGDYHLKSQAGQWDANSQAWITDTNTSPCIDTGNPGCPVGDEPEPNGNRRNMGAYGGTAEASKSPTYWRSIADMTNDCVVDSNDLKVFADYWLQTGQCLPGDFDRSQFVDFKDFVFMANHWLEDNTTPLPLPGQASNPDPANYALGVGPNTDLFWTAGSHTSSHYVYFGTANPPAFIGNQADATFDPGTMDYSTTYYWRIDEVNSTGITTGTLWSFTTQSSPPP